MANTQENLDLGAMMDATLDNIPDAPDFITPPPGIYTLGVKDCKVETYKPKAGGEAQRIRILYTVEATEEVAANEVPVPDGSMFSETFMATQQGLSYFKSRVKAIMNVDSLAGSSLRDMMESIKGTTFDARITIKKTSNPNGGEYENVQIRVIPPSVE